MYSPGFAEFMRELKALSVLSCLSNKLCSLLVVSDLWCYKDKMVVFHNFPVKQENGKGGSLNAHYRGRRLKARELFMSTHISSINDTSPAWSWISMGTGKPKIYSLET